MMLLIRLSGAVAVTLLLLIGGLRVVSGVARQAPPPFTLLEGCDAPCWLGIQPGITTMDEAEVIAAEAGAATRMFGPRNPYLSVILPDDLTLLGRVNTDASGNVIRIIIEVDDRCPADVVYTYGIPSHITYDGRSYRLYYPTHNLRLLWLRTASGNMSSSTFTLDVAANRRVLFADYVPFFRIPWDDFATRQLQDTC